MLSKKHAISGSWRNINAEVEQDVRSDVATIIANGDSIVVGGALGVDYVATDEALKIDPACDHLLIILPTSLEVFENHFTNRAHASVIKHSQAEALISQLQLVKSTNSNALREMGFDICNEETYYARNQEIINVSDSLSAFHVNNSHGVQDAIDRAIEKGLKVNYKQYII